MARAEASLGRLERAAALYREIRKLDPGDPLSKVAARALADLEARGVEPLHPSPEERLAQALDLRRRKYYAEAIAALDAMRAEPDVTGKIRDDVEWNIARCAWESEKFEASLAAFRKIAAETKETRRRRKALRWIGYSLERPRPLRRRRESTRRGQRAAGLAPRRGRRRHRVAVFQRRAVPQG
jgi:tetratricopeptide (TPR) repeat protein